MSSSMNESEKATEPRTPRDAANWAKPVAALKVDTIPAGAHAGTVAGRRATSPIQGFGKMWQKTYRIALEGTEVSPVEVIKVWKERFPEFWPDGNRFYAPLTGIAPGEVALLGMAMPGRITLSTGVMVLYADEESFTLMTPQGHMFAGWITFSAFQENGQTVAQAQVLMRASDPIYEIGMTFGGHRQEDVFWARTLKALAAHFGVTSEPVTQIVCVDSSRQWTRVGNLRQNAMLRSMLYEIGSMPRRLTGRFGGR
ncbi:MAG TPA: hypothetical protein VKU87_02930 [Thermomicrobiaceae bacterium]|nr:hypothetical protein [Thermomicrobiaceae bacterium]